MKRGVMIVVITVVLIVAGIYTKKVLSSITPVNMKQTLQGISVVLDAGHGGTT
jgi:N-acetylmuramoyl-L-alanine amidase